MHVNGLGMPHFLRRIRGGGGDRPAVERVCVVGSGNWGSTVARIIGQNTEKLGKPFDVKVKMWVYEEEVEGRKLSEIINTQHENVKYLPGVKLPSNVIAVPDLAEAATAATILVFALPHQFLPRLLPTIQSARDPSAIAVSLIKGMSTDSQGNLVRISQQIADGLPGCDVSVLMGANVADEVARGDFCEATIGYSSRGNAEILKMLFEQPTFQLRLIPDCVGVEMYGTLKNVIALGAGFVDGLGFGTNTKAAIMRIGMHEMLRFGETFFPGSMKDTILESCGVADLITTCFGGRNRKCAEQFARGERDWRQIEESMLGGQKLQGVSTIEHVHKMLRDNDAVARFPLLDLIYKISNNLCEPDEIVRSASLCYQAA